MSFDTRSNAIYRYLMWIEASTRMSDPDKRPGWATQMSDLDERPGWATRMSREELETRFLYSVTRRIIVATRPTQPNPRPPSTFLKPLSHPLASPIYMIWYNFMLSNHRKIFQPLLHRSCVALHLSPKSPPALHVFMRPCVSLPSPDHLWVAYLSLLQPSSFLLRPSTDPLWVASFRLFESPL